MSLTATATATATARPGQDRRLGSEGLAAQLRADTRPEHVLAESAFDLDSRLVDLGTYRQLLETLAEFYLPLEAALASAVGWHRLAEPFDIAPHLRGDLLVADLRRLGSAPPPSRVAVTGPQPPTSLAGALGASYVLAGSALGGLVIARRARAALGDDVPVAFFSSAGRLDPGRRWRALQMALDGFGATAGPRRREATVQAAAATFRRLTRLLGAHG